MNATKNVEDFAPKPSEAVGAARNATETEFAEERPETARLEAKMKDYIAELDKQEAILLGEVREAQNRVKDTQEAKKYALGMLENIERGKKP